MRVLGTITKSHQFVQSLVSLYSRLMTFDWDRSCAIWHQVLRPDTWLNTNHGPIGGPCDQRTDLQTDGHSFLWSCYFATTNTISFVSFSQSQDLLPWYYSLLFPSLRMWRIYSKVKGFPHSKWHDGERRRENMEIVRTNCHRWKLENRQ